MPKATKTDEHVTKQVTLVRHYDSDNAMKFEGEQFLKFSHVFPAKQPPARDFRVKVEPRAVSYTKGSPPMVKHQMHLDVSVSGAPGDVDRWIAEAQKLSGRTTEMTASEQLRKYHSERARAASARAEEKKDVDQKPAT